MARTTLTRWQPRGPAWIHFPPVHVSPRLSTWLWPLALTYLTYFLYFVFFYSHLINKSPVVICVALGAWQRVTSQLTARAGVLCVLAHWELTIYVRVWNDIPAVDVVSFRYVTMVSTYNINNSIVLSPNISCFLFCFAFIWIRVLLAQNHDSISTGRSKKHLPWLLHWFLWMSSFILVNYFCLIL